MKQDFLKDRRKNQSIVKKRKKLIWRKERTLLFLVILLVVFFMGFSGYNYLSKQIENWLVQIEELSTGEIMRTVPLEALVVRDEKIVYAPFTGSLELAVAEGQRVSVGGILGTVKGGFDSQFTNQQMLPLRAPVAGLVSLQIDGLESILTTGSYKELDLAKLPIDSAATPALKEIVERGQPLVKIINNLKPINLIVPFENQDIVDLAKGEVVNFKWGDSSVELLSARVLDVQTNEDKGVIVLEVGSFVEELLNIRQISLELVLERYSGVIVEESSIVYRLDQPGLMIVDRQRSYQWQEVEIIGQIDSRIAVAGVNAGTKYVKNPSQTKKEVE